MSAVDTLARRQHLHLQSDRRARLQRVECYSTEDDWTYSVTLPHPAVLASVWITPLLKEDGLDVFKAPSGSDLATRPAGTQRLPRALETETLAVRLHEQLATLPESQPGGTREVYRSVRTAARYADRDVFRTYLREAIKAARAAAPTWTPPNRPSTVNARPAPLSAAARQRVHRASLPARQRATAAQWLADYLTSRRDAEQATGFVLASDLWCDAKSTVEDLRDEPDFAAYAMPGRNGFLNTGDEILGARKRRANGAGYMIPNGNALIIAISDAEEIAEDAAEDAAAATSAAREAERKVQ